MIMVSLHNHPIMEYGLNLNEKCVIIDRTAHDTQKCTEEFIN